MNDGLGPTPFAGSQSTEVGQRSCMACVQAQDVFEIPSGLCGLPAGEGRDAQVAGAFCIFLKLVFHLAQAGEGSSGPVLFEQ